MDLLMPPIPVSPTKGSPTGVDQFDAVKSISPNTTAVENANLDDIRRHFEAMGVDGTGAHLGKTKRRRKRRTKHRTKRR